MARLYNTEIFNQTIGEGKQYYTGEEFYSLLGSADRLGLQVFLDAAVHASTSVEVTFETTNVLEQQAWIGVATDKVEVTITALTQLPKDEGLDVPGTGTAYGAFGRFKVTTNHTGATVRIVACGRSS